MNILPKARNKDIVVQEMGTELLIYDLTTHKAYGLNETSAIVYNACNGQSTFEELKKTHKFTDELIFLTLDELKKVSLLTDEIYQSPFAGMTRREVVKKVGLATMIALPLISSVSAPPAAAAQSNCMGNGQTCTPTLSMGNCCSGFWCSIIGCLACVNNGVERCFTPPFNCQSIAYTCCSGNIVAGPSVNAVCTGFQSCFCVP